MAASVAVSGKLGIKRTWKEETISFRDGGLYEICGRVTVTAGGAIRDGYYAGGSGIVSSLRQRYIIIYMVPTQLSKATSLAPEIIVPDEGSTDPFSCTHYHIDEGYVHESMLSKEVDKLIRLYALLVDQGTVVKQCMARNHPSSDFAIAQAKSDECLLHVINGALSEIRGIIRSIPPAGAGST